MRQRDTNDISTALGELDDALFELQAIYDDTGKEGYTVDPVAYTATQLRAQRALIDLMAAADAVVGTGDSFTAGDGTEVGLPEPPLERGPDGLPQFRDDSSGGDGSGGSGGG